MNTATPNSVVQLRQHRRLVAGDRVDERAEREADQRVEQRAGDLQRGEHARQDEREGEPDEDLLDASARRKPSASSVDRGRAATTGADADRQRRRRRSRATRPGIILLENSGASRNSGETRARTRKNAGDLLLGELGRGARSGPSARSGSGVDGVGMLVHSASSSPRPGRASTGRRSRSPRPGARIFGMKESVCSWICVTAWKMETTRPTTSADQQHRQRDLDA